MTLFRSGVYTILASVAQVVLGVLSVAIIARVLGPSGKGVYDLCVTAANMAVMAFGLSLPAGITYVVARRGGRMTRLIWQMSLFAVGVGVATLTGLLGGRLFKPIAGVLPGSTTVVWAAAVTAAATMAYSAFRSALAGNRAFRDASIADIARAFIGTVALGTAALFAVKSESPRFAWLVWANALGTLAATLVYLAYLLRRRGREAPAEEPPRFKGALEYAAPSYVANVVQFLNYRIDVFITSGLIGVGAVGKYQLAVMIAELLRILPAAAQAVIWPTIAAQQDAQVQNARLAARAARGVLLITLVGGVLMATIGAPAISFVFGPAYRSSAAALLALLPGLVLFAATTVLAGYIAGIGRPKLNLYGSAIGLVATVLLDLALIPRWGITGAALASSVSYSATTVFTLVVFARLTDTSIRSVVVPTKDDVRFALGALAKVRDFAATRLAQSQTP